MLSNPRFFCFLLCFAWAFGVSAQVQTTTFNVDASCIPSGFDNLFVTGPWCGWCANDTYNTMTDPDGDGVYSVTVFELNGTVEYKYAINGFEEQENLVNDMVDGANCAPITDYNGYANRTTEGGSSTNDYYGTCDGTCNDYLPAFGCTDNGACNFDPTAEQEDGSCQYLDECGVCGGIGIAQGECDCDGTIIDALGVCGGSCAADADNDGICDDIDDDVWQCEADFSFGEVEFGLSPNPALGEPFENGVLGEPYADVLHILVPATAAGIDETYPPTLPVDSVIVADDVVNGVNDYSGFVFVDTATDSSFFANEIGLSLAYNNNGDSPNASTFLGANQYCAVIQGVPTRSGHYRIDIDIIAWATIFTPFNVPFAFEDFSLTILDSSFGCTNSNACNYNQEATEDAGNCIYADALGVCGGDCLEDDDSNGVCDDSEVLGCAYELADNYDVNVTRDDGSCIFPCEGVVNTNVFDWDGDYVVTVTDFLMMLSVYGDTDVDLDGVWDSGDDCVDTNACNYANDPSEPCAYIDVLGVCGGGCEGDEDNDGICDDIDTCIGVEDECGVCNGPGPTEVVIDDILITYDSVFLPLDNDWYVFPVSADTTFSYTCAPFFGGCGDPLGYQGYDYATVLIGDQCWFAENLRSTNYTNGDPVNFISDPFMWTIASDQQGDGLNGVGAVTVMHPNNPCSNVLDPSVCEIEGYYLSTYGCLYNGPAVLDSRGLCPSGWQVGSDDDFKSLESTLGMPEAELDNFGFRGEGVGHSIKSTDLWFPGNGCNGGCGGNNSSGWTGKPGGAIDASGGNGNAGSTGHWWTSTPLNANSPHPISRILYPSSTMVYRDAGNSWLGYNVRCIRDAE